MAEKRKKRKRKRWCSEIDLRDYFVHAIAGPQLRLRGPSIGPEIRAKEEKTFKT